MRSVTFAAVVVALSVVLAPRVFAAAGDPAGVVRTATGKAFVVRGENTLPAAPGTKLFVGDTLETGAPGSLGVILRDNSTLSLGPDSRLVIRRFLFSPAEGKTGLLARLSRGTMAFVSGLLGKLAPESVRFETPTASIGIRGTYFAVKTGQPVSR